MLRRLAQWLILVGSWRGGSYCYTLMNCTRERLIVTAS
ncbi:Uncharacterised protein [Vibrio cholerae]|nr:Uncharacterised protein [Vibrio cholerae]